MSLSHFDEKSGVITFKTSWGCWWQTVFEVHIIVNLPDNTKPRNVKVIINANDIECKVHDSILFKGQLFKTVHPDESVWTIEDCCILDIILSKAEYEGKDTLWDSLLKDGSFCPDPLTLLEMRKKLDLEKFQLEMLYSLLKDGSFCPDPLTLLEMRKKLDLEKFQLENPGMDFSRAKLSKCYDTRPGPVEQQIHEES